MNVISSLKVEFLNVTVVKSSYFFKYFKNYKGIKEKTGWIIYMMQIIQKGVLVELPLQGADITDGDGSHGAAMG